MRKTILFFLIVVINELIWIDSDIGLDTCANGRWRVEVLLRLNPNSVVYFFLFKLIIFKSIIQFLFMLFLLLLCLHPQF